jgi:hypothetical protein
MTDSNDAHPNVARKGIRSTQAQASFLPPPDPTTMTRNASGNVPPEQTLVNHPLPASEKDVELTATSFGPQVLTYEMIEDKERLSAILEALHAHRAMLHGLLARKQSESTLNPASLKHEIGAISRGIARAEALISELTPP